MSDINWRSYYGDKPDTALFFNPIDPENYDDIMKFSNCTNVVVDNKTIIPGRENCVDAVRGSNYLWNLCHMISGAGVATMTIKGAIDGWTLRSCYIGEAKSRTDMEIGQFDNYWHPGRKPTRNGLIEDCESFTLAPIRVVVWDSEIPKIVNSNVRIFKIPAIVWFPYFTLRWIMVKLGL